MGKLENSAMFVDQQVSIARKIKETWKRDKTSLIDKKNTTNTALKHQQRNISRETKEIIWSFARDGNQMDMSSGSLWRSKVDIMISQYHS